MFTQGVNYASVKSKTSFGASGGAQGAVAAAGSGSPGMFLPSSPCPSPGRSSQGVPMARWEGGEGWAGAVLGFISCPSLWAAPSSAQGCPGSITWDRSTCNGTPASSSSPQGGSCPAQGWHLPALCSHCGELQYFNFYRQRQQQEQRNSEFPEPFLLHLVVAVKTQAC